MKDLKKRVKELLQNTPPQATKFANAIYSILKREKNWVRSNANRNIIDLSFGSALIR